MAPSNLLGGMRLTALVIALFTAAALAAPAAQATPTPPTPLSKADVLILGDSLTVMSSPYFDKHIRSRNWKVAVDAMNGRTFPQGLDILKRNRWVLPSTVVVALGTNDLHTAPGWFDIFVWKAKEYLGPGRRLVLVNLWVDEQKNPTLGRKYRPINDQLRLSAIKHGAQLADWAGHAQKNRAETYWDGVHYPPSSSELRAQFYADALLPTLTPPKR